MPPVIDYTPVVQKLLRRSEEDKVPWAKAGRNAFICRFGRFDGQDSDPITFEIASVEDTYILRMTDEFGDEIFSLSAQDEIVFGDQEKSKLFETLRDLYELARRKALGVNEKLAHASQLLDAI